MGVVSDGGVRAAFQRRVRSSGGGPVIRDSYPRRGWVVGVGWSEKLRDGDGRTN